ncbi:MAG: histidine phosphatase family protein [Nitrospinota bacterium]|nr:histidine phosphatase family protein [Nitrospinota bacterium]
MSNEILILRHGKTEKGYEKKDFDRLLLNRGKQESLQIALWLTQNGLVPDLIISSPAKRALGTAKIVAECFGILEKNIQLEEDLYLCGEEMIYKIIENISKRFKRAMIVGHNPGFEYFLESVVGENELRDVGGSRLSTCSVGCICLKRNWSEVSPEGASLITLIRPKDLL